MSMDENAKLTISPLTAVNWTDARTRVLKSYREWLRAVSEPNSCLCWCSGVCSRGRFPTFDITNEPSRSTEDRTESLL